MVIENKFNLGDIVYIKTDTDQKERMVIGILIRPGIIEYQLSCGETSIWQMEFMISETKDVLKATTN